MVVSHKRHHVAAFFLEKEASVPTEQEAGWLQNLIWMFWSREKLLALLGIEPQFVTHPACSVVSILTELS
jgi:hypothetical protein